MMLTLTQLLSPRIAADMDRIRKAELDLIPDDESVDRARERLELSLAYSDEPEDDDEIPKLAPSPMLWEEWHDREMRVAFYAWRIANNYAARHPDDGI